MKTRTIAVLIALAFTGSAHAQGTTNNPLAESGVNPTCDGYGEACPTPTPEPPDKIPFTGFEVGLVALTGLALVGTGLAIRRATRSDRGTS